jgi:hypothetical protein
MEFLYSWLTSYHCEMVFSLWEKAGNHLFAQAKLDRDWGIMPHLRTPGWRPMLLAPFRETAKI